MIEDKKGMNEMKKRIMCLLLFLCGFNPIILAQDFYSDNKVESPTVYNDISEDNMEELRTSIADLTKRLNDIEDHARRTVTGAIFMNYTYDLLATVQDNNYFDVTRGYINFRKKVSDQVSLRITPDFSYRLRSIQNSTTKGAGIMAFLKYAYVDLALLSNQVLTFGLLENPWVSFLEKVWQKRYIAQTFPDMKNKIATADLGIKLSGTFFRGHFDYSLGILNGEGFRDAEVNKYKDIGLRTTFIPLPKDNNLKGLKLSIFYSQGYVSNLLNRKIRADSLLSFQHDLFSIGIEYLNCVDENVAVITTSSGYSLFGYYNLTPRLEILLRCDSWASDLSLNNNNELLTIYGISYEIIKGGRLCLNNQQVYKSTGGGVFVNQINLNTTCEF